MWIKQVLVLLLILILMGIPPDTGTLAGVPPIGDSGCVTCPTCPPCSPGGAGPPDRGTSKGDRPSRDSGTGGPDLGAGCAGPAPEGNLVKPQSDYDKKLADFEARKADVLDRRLKEISRLRKECRDGLPACSQSGKAFDQREADRRRDIQYFIWGEASYYIPWSDTLIDVPPELEHEIGTWGGIKLFGYGGDWFWITFKRNVKITIRRKVLTLGSTAPGGDGAAKKGWQKAYNDNGGFTPGWRF